MFYTLIIIPLLTASTDREVYPMGLSTLFSNRASCHLKSGDPKACVEDCTSALDLNPNNVKTYLKRAQAYEMLEKLVINIGFELFPSVYK